MERPQGTVDDPLLVAHAGLLAGLAGRGRRHGQPFLIGPGGRPDGRVNAVFASRRMLSRSPLTWKNAQSLGMWLNFLLALGRRWDEATEDDAEYFKEWRLSEQSPSAAIILISSHDEAAADPRVESAPVRGFLPKRDLTVAAICRLLG